MTRWQDSEGNVYDERALAAEVRRNHFGLVQGIYEADLDRRYTATELLREYGAEDVYWLAFRYWLDERIENDPDWLAAMIGLVSVDSRSRRSGQSVSSDKGKYAPGCRTRSKGVRR